jgi:chemotaxis protein CheD
MGGTIDRGPGGVAPGAESRPLSPRPPAGCGAAVYLHAGQIAASREPCAVTTVVGSCVMVCLFDPARGMGGANHYVLPAASAAALASPRFGDVAIPELVARLVALGCRASELSAKVFGGASILQASERIGAESLGAKNVRLARSLLSDMGISVLAEDVGGTRGRKVVFHTDAGSVWVRRL